jgi:hypothetical protein
MLGVSIQKTASISKLEVFELEARGYRTTNQRISVIFYCCSEPAASRYYLLKTLLLVDAWSE